MLSSFIFLFQDALLEQEYQAFKMYAILISVIWVLLVLLFTFMLLYFNSRKKRNQMNQS